MVNGVLILNMVKDQETLSMRSFRTSSMGRNVQGFCESPNDEGVGPRARDGDRGTELALFSRFV